MFQPAIYQQRRDKLAALLPDSLILFLGNVDSPMNYRDNIFPFVQDSSFRYFFGLNEPGLAGIIDTASGDTTLFGNDPDVADIVWTGELPTLTERAALVKVGRSQPYAVLADVLAAAQAAGRAVHYLQPYRGESEQENAIIVAQHPVIQHIARQQTYD